MHGDQPIINILNELMPMARYERRGQSITGTDYRNAWNSPLPALSRGWIFANLTRPEGFERLIAGLRVMLEPFVITRDGDEFVQTNIGLIAAGVGSPTTLGRFAEHVLTAAVLIGSDRTVTLLRAWANGEPVTYTRFVVLSGLRIEGDEQKFGLDEGFKIQSLPNDQGQLLALHAPEMWVGSPMSMAFPLGGPEIYGAPAMVIEMTQGPVFSQAEEITPESKTVASGPLGRLYSLGTDAPLLAGLSLACNSPVSPSCAWSKFSTDVQSFVPWSRSIPNQVVLYGGRTGFSPRSPVLTDEALDQAIRLAGKVNEYGLGDKTRTALARWTKSMQGHFADQFIDLRIALEALFAPDGGAGEISYRLQTRCARYMAESFDERKAIAREIKDFYNTASGFAHGGLVLRDGRPPRQRHRQQLDRARQICRDAIIKIIEDNRGQDIDVGRVTLA